MLKLNTTLKYRIRDAWYTVTRPFRLFVRKYIKRYHMLNMSNKMHGYSSGYVDPSEQVLYANFAILKNFVELEKPFKFYNLRFEGDRLYSNETDKPVEETYLQEIYDLYQWWTYGRNVDSKKLDELGGKVTYRFEETGDEDLKYGKYYEIKFDGPHLKWVKMMKRFEDKDDQMLIRLMKVRKHLWL